MKMKFKFSKLFISMLISIVILNPFANSVYTCSNMDSSFHLCDGKLELGKIIPFETSDAVFSGNISYDSLVDIQFKKIISISGDNCSINLSLFINSSEVELNYAGKLYQSIRSTDENPVYIGVFENNHTIDKDITGQPNDLSDDFEIIYFEISNDNAPYHLDNNLRNSSAITMYLRSKEGTIYDLGSKIILPVILTEVKNQAPSDKDINWFLAYFTGVYHEEPIVPSRSAYNSSWTGNLHTLTFKVGNYEHKYTATPYIDFTYGDVPTAGETSFSMSLKMAESHQYRLVGNTNWIVDTGNYTKCFYIDNVQLSWTAGGNTQITQINSRLNTHNQGDGNFTFLGLAASIMQLYSQTTSLSTILNIANSILDLNTGSQHSFTNNCLAGSLIQTSAFKIKYPTNYSISESGYGMANVLAERFEYIAMMTTTNSLLTKNYRTYAVADFTFNLEWSDVSGQQSGNRVYTSYKALGYYNNYVAT